MLLDPTLPEKQRARRRLVGAIALVLAAIVILPMVLDSHPKPITNDIAIDIPNRPAPAPRASHDSDDDAQADVAPDRADMSSAGSSAAAAGAEGKTSQQSAAKAAVPGAQAQSKQADSKSATAKPAQSVTSSTKGQRSSQTAAIAAPSPADADSGTPAAPAGARFAVQLGVFGDDASARAWETKLKAAGVPAYVEHRKQADGTMRTLLRAGPFADRTAASSAIAKVRAAGLTANAGNASQ